MRYRFSFRIANPAAVICSLLVLTVLVAGSSYAQAQTPAADQGNQASPAPVSSVVLAAHTPQRVLDGVAFRLGHYSPENKLRLTLAIQPPHMADEEQFLKELTTKGSPNFHKFLTPDEWNARFAPSAEDEQAVVDWAVSQGFTVTHRFSHRLLVDLEGTSGLIEKVFGVTINNYQVGDEVDFSNDRDPLIPANLSGIVYSVQGLNNIERDHGSRPGPQTKGADYAEGPAYAEGPSVQADAVAPRATPASITSNDASNSTLFTNGYANPTEIYNSQTYNYDGLQNLGHCCNPYNDSGGTPNVSNIAIAAFGTYLDSDVSGFQAAYPYLAYSYQPHYIDGTINCSGNPSPCPDGETTQDLEWTIATANSFGSSNDTAKIFIYEGANGNNGTFTDMYGFMLSDNLARVFTTSWSCTEVYGCSTSTMDARHAIFNNMLGQGWTLIAASGDRGSSDDCFLDKNTDTYNTAHEAVAYPGSDFDVLAAGGTFLQVYNDGSWDYEHAWQGGTSFGSCGYNNGGSGGGVSTYYGKPGFQGYSTWNGESKRSTPDISLNAIGIGQNLYINGNLQCCANGTSIVAPELAGFFAQENAYLSYIGNVCGTGGTSACTPVGPPMQFFYPAAYYGAGYVSHFPFYDMTGAYCNSNDVTAAQGLGYYCSGVGWDHVTGWGSANMLQLAWAINWYLIPATGTNPAVSWRGPATGQWYNSDQVVSWTVSDPEPSGSTPSSGIAGFTQAWDSIPSDSFSQPHGGIGDTFWSGPHYANISTGCLSFNGADGCSSLGSPQGCHTAHVRGWNNQGWTSGDQTYGPVCYDTVDPTITSSTSPALSGWLDQSVVVTLAPTDPGGSNASGIYRTYYAVNNDTTCAPGSVSGCSVYSGPVTISAQGQTAFYYFTEDNAGNWSTWGHITISIDTTKPVTTASLAGNLSSGIYYSVVTVTLSATDNLSGVAHTYYTLDGGSQTTYSAAFNVTTTGSHTVKYWSVDVAGNVESTHTLTFTIEPVTAATMTSPAPSSTLVGPSVTFSWAAQTGATSYILGLGTTPGANNLYSSGPITATSATAPNLPTNGETIYATLLTNYNNDQLTESYTYTAANQAALTTPAPGSTFTSTTVTFNWTAATGATGYLLHVGSTGVGSGNLGSSGQIAGTTVTFNNLPANGETIYARLYTYFGTTYSYTDYTYTALTATAATLSTPTPGSMFTSTTVTFDWTAVTGATKYLLYLGTTGVGSSNVYSSGGMTGTTATATNLPGNGETVYARLYTYFGTTSVSADFTYTDVTQSSLTTPAPGITFTSTTVTFNWTAATGATKYLLHLGTTGVGSGNVYSSGGVTGNTATAINLPGNGETVYVRLYTYFGTAYAFTDYTYTDVTQSSLTTPAPGSTFTSTAVTFDWTAATGATKYLLHVGSTGVGSGDLGSSGQIAGTTVTFNNLPANGETIYARLYTYFGTAYAYTDYTYTALTGTAATLTSPAAGSTFTSNSVTFDWTAVTGATKYVLDLGSTGVGSSNLYSSGGATGTSVTANNLPANGETIYARLYTYFGAASVSADFTYTAVTQSSLTTPAPGSTFTNTTVTFNWTAATGATGYLLHVGSTGVGSGNLGSSGQIAGTTVTFNNLPANGETIYARLFTYFGTAYAYTDYTYTAK
jgi:hypothetical protein